MSISSMTGFSRQNGSLEFENLGLSWYFELKSVNGKSLEVKVRTPSWLEAVSQNIKSSAGKYFSRGNISVYLDISSSKVFQSVKINDDLLNLFTQKALELCENYTSLNKPTAGELLSIKGVVELEESRLSEEEIATLQEALIASFEEACKFLQKDRANEGEKLKKALADILNKIEKTVAEIERVAVFQPAKLKEKIEAQIKSLTETVGVSEERIAQEVVLLALKADVKEEIDRLKIHLKTAEEMLSSSEPVGRRLDFLCQELNREANTTCSKSSDVEMTNLGMMLKTLIEQFREQVQNVE